MDLLILCGASVTLVIGFGILLVAKIRRRKRSGLGPGDVSETIVVERWPEEVVIVSSDFTGNDHQLHSCSMVDIDEKLSPLPAHMNRDFMHLPPIGSAAAEFQNDFIQVSYRYSR